ncbi:hypothetical protein BRD00_14875 [Halobacteriales archaeon QS_8_69_26]|nr:MAG: hypothetical protein BRD00_14875 [Halobacteriales archaeon QS_8_69_26]
MSDQNSGEIPTPGNVSNLDDLTYSELRQLATQYEEVDGSASSEEIKEQLRATGDFADDDPQPVGVKLGSTRTVVVAPDGKGGTNIHRTLTCLATYEDALTGEERVLYGDQAATEYPDRVQYMLRSGLPQDQRSTELAKQFFSAFIASHDLPENSAVVYAIPALENEQGLEHLKDVIESSNIGNALIRSYPESLCASIPAMGDGLRAIDDIFIAINMGSTNLEASAYRRGEQVTRYATGAVTGNEVDRRIASYVQEETQGRVNIDRTTAREYKEQYADFVSFQSFTDVVQQPGGGAHEFTIEDSVMDAMEEYVDSVVDEVANNFLPRVANDHMKTYNTALERPIVLTGGMVAVRGITEEIEKRLSAELQREIDVIGPEDPVSAAAEGAQRIAARLVEQEAY